VNGTRVGDAHPPLSDDEVRGLGFEPTWRGWMPLTPEVDARMQAAVERRRTPRHPAPRRIEGEPQPCVVCGEDAEPSAVGTPTCSPKCLGQLADAVLPEIADVLARTGTPQVIPTPIPKPPPKHRPSLRRDGGGGDVEHARDRLGTCSDVLERHGHHVRGRMAFCPFHLNERTPAMSLYERDGRSRFHCFGCDVSGDALDLEADLAGDTLADTIRRWS
jgi:hypothetical protein